MHEDHEEERETENEFSAFLRVLRAFVVNLLLFRMTVES
jgi:hypothetical protein